MTPDDMDPTRLEASRWFWYSAVLEDSGLDDVERGSGSTTANGDGTESFWVLSRSRGRVRIGTIATATISAVAAGLDAPQLDAYRAHVGEVKVAVFDVVTDYARELEARRRAPLEGKAAKSATREDRARQLRARHTVEEIAEIMTAEGHIRGTVDPKRTVRRWLAAGKSRTDRETSV
jgi:hypothetical protein